MKKLFTTALLMVIVSTFSLYSNWERCGGSGMVDTAKFRAVTTSGTNIYASIYYGAPNYGIYFSSDNGNTWAAKNKGMESDTVYTILVEGNNIFAGTYKKGGLKFSNDGGSSWVVKNKGLLDSMIVSLTSKDSFVYAGTINSGMFVSSDSGKTWLPRNTGFGSSLYVRALIFVGDNLYAGTYKDGIFMSTDNGSNWTCKTGLLVSEFMNVNSFTLNGQYLFAGTQLYGVFISSDYGDNWQAISGLSKFSNTNCLSNKGNNLFIGTPSNGVYLSTDNGTTCNTINDGMATNNEYVRQLAINDDYIFAATNSGLYRRKLSEIITDVADNKKQDKEIKVFPNPVKDFIEIGLPSSNQSPKIKIYSVEGIEVYSKPSEGLNPSEGYKIDVSSFAPGVYYVKVGDRVLRFVKIC